MINTYRGPRLSHMIPARYAVAAVASMRKKPKIPIHLPMCSGRTISNCMAPVTNDSMKKNP